MDLNAVEQRLLAVENALVRLGVDLGRSLQHVKRTPAMTCINNGVVVEAILRDLWRRLGIRGEPAKRRLEDLLVATARRLEENGTPFPRRIYDYVRAIQLARNRAAHHTDVTRDDAAESLRQLSDVAFWYFVDFTDDARTVPGPLVKDKAAELRRLRYTIDSVKASRVEFGLWYRRKFAWFRRIRPCFGIPLQVLLWFNYGFLWIPAWFLLTTLWNQLDHSINKQTDARIQALEERLQRIKQSMDDDDPV